MTKPTVVIHVADGEIQDAWADGAVKVLVVNHDPERYDSTSLATIDLIDSGGQHEDVIIFKLDVYYRPKNVVRVVKAFIQWQRKWSKS